MNSKQLLSLAYNMYADVLDIINIVSDKDYLSITELSKLLSCICTPTQIQPQIITKILLKKNTIKRQQSQFSPASISKDLFPSKYIATSKGEPYCKLKKSVSKRCFIFTMGFQVYI